MPHVQAVVFSALWTTAAARAWLSRHGYVPIKRAHRTANTVRYRLAPPLAGARYYTKKLPGGVALVIAR